jgi:NAD(P)-dependent dehydrogenase (short-subunit alcohol dehydrogenase family)
MKQLNEQLAVVTGAGSGIGRAIAEALAAEGARVVATDVNEGSAVETRDIITAAGGWAGAALLDVSDRESIEASAVSIREDFGVPAVLVNNAGIAVGGMFLDTGLDSWERIIAINLMGVVHCTRAFLPAMAESGRPGHVVNVSSMLGYFGSPGVSAYCTTKFGVFGFSEVLRAEMARHGIGVSVVCPGMIRTSIINSGVLEAPDEDIEQRRKEINALYEKRNYSPEKVARAVVRGIRRNRAVVPVTPEAWITYYAKRWTPWLVRGLAARYQP